MHKRCIFSHYFRALTNNIFDPALVHDTEQAALFKVATAGACKFFLSKYIMNLTNLLGTKPSPKDGLVPGHNTPENNTSLDIFEGLGMQDRYSTVMTPSSPRIHIVLFAIKIVLFVPWCFSVGGAILLYPQYLNFITFKTGYIAPPDLAQRFKHWAEHAWHFIVIFLGLIAAIAYCEPVGGTTIFALTMTRFFHVWSGFKFDQTVPLGQDDQQSIYMVLVMKNLGIGSDTIVLTRSEDDGTILRNTVTCD